MNSDPHLKYIPCGDSAFIIKTGDEISPELNITVRKLLARIKQEKINGVTDFIPSYNELMICYDPLVTGYRKLLDRLHALEDDLQNFPLPESMLIEIPVKYGGSEGPDLREVADQNKITPDEVIQIHSAPEYLVYMLGFTPGFCYLGGLDERIASPRKSSPRLKIPAGSVGIAGNQTGIYPLESPGGWQLIGRTPLKLFDPYRNPVFLVNQGDRIRFKPISPEEFSEVEQNFSLGNLEMPKNKKQ